MEFNRYLEEKGLFTEEECNIIDTAFETEIFPKKEVILKANKFSDEVLFIESGLVRAFYNKDGKDITHFFFAEDYFIAPINSLYYNKFERYEMITLEKCHIRTIRFQDFMALGVKIPQLLIVALEFAAKLCDFLSLKLDIVKFETAFDKYNLFLEMYPNLINRVSLGDTASFLGITQQTLSVVRAQIK